MASVAQLARAPDCGSGGRRFNSCHSPHVLIVGKSVGRFEYDKLVQKALLSVVKEVLSSVAAHGLDGNHHFYIRFRTDHPRTRVPKFLRDQHPEEVMIVLQHQFWNLEVQASGISVELSFTGIRETLFIPFDALTAFVDPSVKFALQFVPHFDDTFSPSDGPDDGERKKPSVDSGTQKDATIVSFDSLKKK